MNSSDLSVQRVRHDIKMRRLQVLRKMLVTPHLVRITLTGEDLADFVSASFDDHVKLFFAPDGARDFVMPEGPLGRPPGPPAQHGPKDPNAPAKRDYTPRRYDRAARELDIEFVLHDAGPASTWAAAAQAGDRLSVAGPRGSFIIPHGFDWQLMIGDETALPAIGRRLEELPRLPQGTRIIVVAEVENLGEQVTFTSPAEIETVWVHRERATSNPGVSILEQALRQIVLPTSGEGYVWAAGEAAAMRGIYQYLVGERGIDKARVRASAYWKRGAEAVHESMGD